MLCEGSSMRSIARIKDVSINTVSKFLVDTGTACAIFHDLCRVCDFFFGKARQGGSSHRVYKMPWQGDPRVNIQNDQGRAKPYQVRQVLRAIDRLEAERGTQE